MVDKAKKRLEKKALKKFDILCLSGVSYLSVLFMLRDGILKKGTIYDYAAIYELIREEIDGVGYY
jgi:hypothetical protein